MEAEPLKALGILVNENTIKNYAYTKGIAEKGKALTEAQKVEARYGVILESTKKAQGDLARTLDSPTNKLRVMKEQATQIGIEFGQILIPVLEKLIKIIKPLMDRFQGLSKGQKDLVVKIALIGAALGPVIFVVGKVIAIAGTLSSVISTISAALAAAGGASAVMGGAFAALTGPVGIAIAAVAGLISLFVLLYKNNEGFRNNVKGTWTKIKELISVAVDRIKIIISVFVSIAQKYWSQYGEYITNIFSSAFGVLASIVNNALTAVKNIINIITKVIQGDWSGAWEGVKKLFKDYLDGLADTAKQALKVLINIFKYWLKILQDLIPFVWKAISSQFKLHMNIIKNIVNSGWNAIKKNTSSVWNNIKNAIQNPIKSAYKFLKEQVNNIKNLFSKLKIKLPKIKLPHFSISGDFSIKPPSVPKFSVNWYAQGGIFNRPSVIGVGEAETEAVIPLDRLDDLIAKAIEKIKVKDDKSNLTLNIEKFINGTGKDIEELIYEMEFYRRRISSGRGGL